MSGYNGWANYPTWCVNLWISNDPVIAETVEDAIAAMAGSPNWRVADMLKGMVDDLLSESGMPDSGMFVDLLGWAIRQVNWDELADHYIADYVSEHGPWQGQEEQS